MRRFKFVGNESYLWDNKPILNRIYNGDYVWNYNGVKGASLSEWAHEFPNEWQEVFEEPTLQDRIQELKDFAKGQGFSVDVTVDKVDIWDGVEFGECTGEGHIRFKKGVIYRRVENSDIDSSNCFYYDGIRSGSFYGGGRGTRGNFKPSNQEAYVKQLKKEAFERFGEIKEGDRFERDLQDYKGEGVFISNQKSRYFKDGDEFHMGGICIYQEGQWATKIPEKIEVKWNTVNDKVISFSYSGNINLINRMPELASQVEAYLNGEVAK